MGRLIGAPAKQEATLRGIGGKRKRALRHLLAAASQGAWSAGAAGLTLPSRQYLPRQSLALSANEC